jgi:hypothetical protein
MQLEGSRQSERAWVCSHAGFSSQNGDRALGVCYRRAQFCCAFLRAKGLTAKDIHKEMFPVYGGKCLSRKACRNWLENFSLKDVRKSQTMKRKSELAKTTTKRFLCCGFRGTIKAMRQVRIDVGGGYVEKWTFLFQVRISHVLRFISIC